MLNSTSQMPSPTPTECEELPLAASPEEKIVINLQIQELLNLALRKDSRLLKHELDDVLREHMFNLSSSPELMSLVSELAQSEQDPKLLQTLLALMQRSNMKELGEIILKRLEATKIETEQDLDIFFELINSLIEVDKVAAIGQIGKMAKDPVLCERLLVMLYSVGKEHFDALIDELAAQGDDVLRFMSKRVKAALA